MHRVLPDSFLIRVWTEPDERNQPVVRGWIQHVTSGHKTHFSSLELPLALLRASVDRLAGRDAPID